MRLIIGMIIVIVVVVILTAHHYISFEVSVYNTFDRAADNFNGSLYSLVLIKLLKKLPEVT